MGNMKFMKFCDKFDSILEWGSEILEVPYINEVDGKQHTYVTDFFFVCRDKLGAINKYIFEVKPKCQSAVLNQNNHIIDAVHLLHTHSDKSVADEEFLF